MCIKRIIECKKKKYLCAKNLSNICVFKMKLIIIIILIKSINLLLTINAYLFKNKQRLCKKHIKKATKNYIKIETFKNAGSCL